MPHAFLYNAPSSIMLQLSVVIPAYNEAERLPNTLCVAYDWLSQHITKDFEIIVVDDGSNDGTRDRVTSLLADRPRITLLPAHENIGKGGAVRRGMLHAHGLIRLFMDADHSTHIKEVEKVFTAINKGADVVIASRQHRDSDISRHQSWLREHMGMGFNRLMHACVDLTFQDTQCGFKAFSADAADAIFTRAKLNGFSFDVELLFLAQRLGFSICEIPVHWVNEPSSKVRILIDPLIMFADIVRIRRLHQSTDFRSSRNQQ
ncbi:MAG: glycosyltransferase family 2 protein [Mariprofundaceae bacterium]|nr:glycosyltransferase family 2 protein [Mariprofundaceae bacterium]